MNNKQLVSFLSMIINGVIIMLLGWEIYLENNFQKIFLLVFFAEIIWFWLFWHYSKNNKQFIRRYNEAKTYDMIEKNRRIEQKNLSEHGETYEAVKRKADKAYKLNHFTEWIDLQKKLSLLIPVECRPNNLKSYELIWFWPWFIINIVAWLAYVTNFVFKEKINLP